MLVTDILLIGALAILLVAWWWRALSSRSSILIAAAIFAVGIGLIGVMNDRWQAGVGAVVGVVFLLTLLINKLRNAKRRTGVPYISGTLFSLLALFAFLMIYWFPIRNLPAPTGEHAVGVRDFELVDSDRKGVLMAGPEDPRRLLVRVWYPAGDVDGFKRRNYYSKLEKDTSAEWLGGGVGLPWLLKYMVHAKTNSYDNAPLLAGADNLPTVIFSHGYMGIAGQNTVLMEELASHGYAVYSVQHTYESGATVFPDGSVAETDPNLIKDVLAGMSGDDITASTTEAFAGETFEKRLAGQISMREIATASGSRLVTKSGPMWVADRIFVHDALERGDAPDVVADIAAASNFQNTGQMGMSFGGSTTGAVCLVDRRCAAMVNLDGGDYHTPVNVNMPAPFLVLSSDFQTMVAGMVGDENVDAHGPNNFFYERPETTNLREDVYRLKVNGSAHLGVTDLTWFMRRPLRNSLFGTVDDTAMLAIQNDFVRGFFDKHLKGVTNDFPNAEYTKHDKWVEPVETATLRKWWLSDHPEDETVQVILETSLGDIEIALYPKRAPISAGNFLAYVDGGYFDGASFYRASEKTDGQKLDLVQGGLLGPWMTASADELASYSATSVLPPIAHETTTETGIPNERGTLTFARLAPGTAGSEFFINVSDNSPLNTGEPVGKLDGLGYATFGRVLRGMRIVDHIQKSASDAPTAIDVLKDQILREPIIIKRAYRVVPKD